MNKKTRLIIFFACVAVFFTVSPVLIMYSIGYRFDFTNAKIVATGGIYVRTFPSADEITIDTSKTQKPGLFSNAVFMQNLLPTEHSVFIQKEGYYEYRKTLPVLEKEVTKLENVILFKKDVLFEAITDAEKSPFLPENQSEKFTIVGNNLYYSDSAQNDSLTKTVKNTALIKGLLSFTTTNSNIFWLQTDGFIYQTDLTNLVSQNAKTKKAPEKITAEPLIIDKKGSFQMAVLAQDLFVNNNGTLSTFNTQTKILESFAQSVKGFEISPDRKNIAYYTDNEIFVSLLDDTKKEKIMLAKTAENITDLLWINNDYVIFTAGNSLTISEIDYRGNINSVPLSQFILPKMIYNQQENKLYILSQDEVFISEKLIP